ncbi:hypothetical protein BDQ17DRAFT_1257290 [Cyathus striatus]|nr:hypothetical protein BDQ17DRAFT_1257290 [Cyathus striatus]
MPARSETVWLDDGNIILQAEYTQFKVHRSILSRNSTVFRDMFSFPQPPSTPSIEDCPLIHLPDSAKDAQNLLSLLYDNLSACNSRSELPFSVLASMLRLGRKYEIHSLRDEAAHRLRQEYPKTLQAWTSTCRNDFTSGIAETEHCIFDTLNLALEASLRTVLPAAYYECLLEEVVKIMFGIKLGDSNTLSRLLPESQAVCILARDKILNALPKYTLSYLDDRKTIPCRSCISTVQCISARAELICKLWKPAPNIRLALFEWSDVLGKGLCGNCFEEAKKHHAEGRKKMWDNLPSFFGLLSWDKLEDFE